jgi:hypothetical protein
VIIKGFFDNVDHKWHIKFLEHDIADKKFIGIIEKFLKAGIMEDGKYLDSERGTQQGNEYNTCECIFALCVGQLVQYCDKTSSSRASLGEKEGATPPT